MYVCMYVCISHITVVGTNMGCYDNQRAHFCRGRHHGRLHQERTQAVECHRELQLFHLRCQLPLLGKYAVAICVNMYVL